MANIIREASRDDLHYIAENLRAEDRAELQALHGPGVNCNTVLYVASLQSDPCYVWCDEEGTPIAAFGFSKMLYKPQVGVPWLLGTDQLKLYARGYVREARRVVAEVLQEKFGYLCNYVHDENKSSIKFLKAVGFTMHEPEPKGGYGGKFRLFDIGDKEGCLNASLSGTLLTDDIKQEVA